MNNIAINFINQDQNLIEIKDKRDILIEKIDNNNKFFVNTRFIIKIEKKRKIVNLFSFLRCFLLKILIKLRLFLVKKIIFTYLYLID